MTPMSTLNQAVILFNRRNSLLAALESLGEGVDISLTVEKKVGNGAQIHIKLNSYNLSAFKAIIQHEIGKAETGLAHLGIDINS